MSPHQAGMITLKQVQHDTEVAHQEVVGGLKEVNIRPQGG
jgi:hypothetical protein